MCVNRNCNEASDSDSHSHSNRNTHRQDTIQHDTSYELEPQPKQVAIRSAVYRATSKYQPTSMTTPRPRSHLHHIIRMSMLRSILLGGLLLSSATTRATFDAPSSNTNKKKEEVEGRGGGWHGRSLDAMPSSSWATMPLEEMEMELPMERRVFPLTTSTTTTTLASTTSSSVARPRRQRVLQERELCSCSPPVFSIRLALSNDCSDDSLKANVGGIRGTLCLLGEVDGGGGDDGGGSDGGGGGGGSGGGQETDMPTDMPTYFPTPFASQGGGGGGGGDDVPTILEPTALPTTYRPTDPPMEVDDPFRPPVPPPAPPSDGNDGDSETIDVGGGENDELDDGEDVIVDGGNGTATNINTNTTNETTNDDANDGTSETIDVGGGQTDDNVPSPTFAPSYPWPTYNPWPTFSPTSGGDVAAKTIGAGGTDTVTYAPSSPWPTFAPTADSKPAPKAGTATSSVAGGIGTGTGSGSAPTPSSIERYYGYAPPGHHQSHRRRDLIHVDRRDEGGEAEQDHEQTGEEEAEEVPREERPRIVRHSDAIDGDHRHHDQRARIPHVDHPHDGWKGRDATRNAKKNDGDAPTTERHRQRRRQQQQQQQQQQQRRIPQHLSGTVADIESWASLPPNDEFFARFPEFRARQEELYRIRHGPSWRRLLDRDHLSPHDDYDHRFRHLQENSTVPTQLVSAQFLEIDTSPDMNIINQDDQYLNLTSDDDDLVEIEDLSFTSVSSMLDPSVDIRDQLEYVPGGAILILIGRTDEGEIVRNRLLWTYTNGCGREDVPVFEGDEFGWAVFSDLEPAREEFCPASGAAPTPSTPSPTPSDSDMATPAPTAFSMDYYESGDERTRKLVEHMDLDGVRFSKRASSNDRPRRRRRSQPRPSRSGGENGSPTLMREVERSYGKEERRRRDVGLEREEFGRRILSPVLDTKEKKKEMTKKEKDLGEYHEEVEFGRHLKQRRLRKQERSS